MSLAIDASTKQIKIEISIQKLKDRKLFIATPMYGGLCIFSNNLIQTEDGEKSIKWIVDNKYSGKVLSFDETTNEFTWNRVVNWFSRRNGKRNDPSSKKKWLRVKTGSNKKELICSEDHPCAVLSDPLQPEISFEEAANIQNKFIIRNLDKDNCLLNSDQISCLLGTMLGDGHVTKQGTYRSVHSISQQGYNEYLQKILGGSIKEISMNGFGQGRKGSILSLPVNAQTKFIRNLMYMKGKKTVQNILQYINEKSLAFWYMDDGYLVKSTRDKPYSILCTDGFSKEDCDLLNNMLMEKFGIKSSVIKYKKYFRIALSVSGSEKFWRMISPYMHISMQYKLPNGFNHSPNYEFLTKPLSYACSLVTKLKTHKKSSRLYDIEVENTHNFVSNGSLVHNCHGHYMNGMLNLASLFAKYGMAFRYFSLQNESLITRARNYCADEFLRSDATHMLFIDSDIDFKPDDVMFLLALADPDSDKDIVCGPYPKKNISWEKVKVAVDKGLADADPAILENFVSDFVFNPVKSGSISLAEPFEVLESGTGFMMIQRRVLEKFKEAHPELSYLPDHRRSNNWDGSREITAFFNDPIDPVSKRFLSEDYYFCQEARKLGMKVWLCPWMNINHMGTYKFVGNMEALATVGASPTVDVSKLNKR